MTHICVSKLTTIVSDNGLSPGRCQDITQTNAGILLIGHLGTNLSEILIEIYTFSFKKMHFKMLSVKWRPCCLSLNVLIYDISLYWIGALGLFQYKDTVLWALRFPIIKKTIVRLSYRGVNARNTKLHCVSNGVMSFLHWPIVLSIMGITMSEKMVFILKWGPGVCDNLDVLTLACSMWC